ncbi:MAG: YtxH domain-containing protein [Calditrichia bacterium]
MFDSRDSAMDFLKGFLVGTFTATAVTLLYAPQTGKKFRKNIRKSSSKMWDEAGSRLEDMQDDAEKMIRDTEKRFRKLLKDAESSMEDIKKKASDIKGSVDSKISKLTK